MLSAPLTATRRILRYVWTPYALCDTYIGGLGEPVRPVRPAKTGKVISILTSTLIRSGLAGEVKLRVRV